MGTMCTAAPCVTLGGIAHSLESRSGSLDFTLIPLNENLHRLSGPGSELHYHLGMSCLGIFLVDLLEDD